MGGLCCSFLPGLSSAQGMRAQESCICNMRCLTMHELAWLNINSQETLDARTEYPGEGDDTPNHHRINQYIIKEEIGRGSYGAVHLAVDQYGTEYVGCPISLSIFPHPILFFLMTNTV